MLLRSLCYNSCSLSLPSSPWSPRCRWVARRAKRRHWSPAICTHPSPDTRLTRRRQPLKLTLFLKPQKLMSLKPQKLTKASKLRAITRIKRFTWYSTYNRWCWVQSDFVIRPGHKRGKKSSSQSTPSIFCINQCTDKKKFSVLVFILIILYNKNQTIRKWKARSVVFK